MRERFGDWGAGLSDADFACALAAAGVLWNWKHPRGVDLTPELLASYIRGRMSPARVLPWHLSGPPRLGADILMQAWRAFRDSVGQGRFRIEVEASAGDWILEIEQLARPEVGAFRVEVRQEPLARGRRPEEGAYSVRELAEGYRSPARNERPEPLTNDEPEKDPGTKTNYRVSSDRESRPPRSKDPVPERVPGEPPPRFLQARLRHWRRWYQVHVRIGLSDREWSAVEEPFPVPPEPPEPEGHRLTVIFWEPRVSPAARIEHLWLPPQGSSERLAFPIEMPDGVREIAARITVLHNNRVLQTGLLRAEPGGSSSFTLDATPRTRLEGLSGRGRFDLALVLNHDAEGIPRMTAVAEDRAVVIPVGESAVEALTRALGDQISRIAASPERYETLQSEGTEELLRTLAQHGGLLHQYLSGFEMLGKFEPETDGPQPRVHLTAARPDSFFPVELLYRFEVPEDTAKLCSHAMTALAQGACPAECPSEKSETVCPLGFWGMCRIIERHNHRRVEKRPQTGFDLRPEPVQPRSRLDISGKALVAASDAASRHDAGAVETLLEKLRQRGPAEEVKSWKDWRARVAADHPKLLVLLPHHERKDGFEILQIGAADILKFVKPEHVDPGSIVLLMGCETNLAKIAFDSFVIQFILNGAAIVVSTIATILGRHASPATARLIELLDEEAREEDSTFGEVMLRLRQKLVAEQTPMALGLTAYGDADWILTRQD